MLQLIIQKLTSKKNLANTIDNANNFQSSSSRMRVMNHNWSATKQRLHPQSVAKIIRHSVLWLTSYGS